MKRIVFLERNSFPPGVPIRSPGFPHEWVEFGETRPDEAAARLQGAHVAVTNKCRIDASVFAAAPTLELVAVSATGTDCVDKEAARAAGVPVTNVTGYAADSVAEHALALLLALARAVPAYDRAVAEGRWAKARQFCLFDYPILDLAGRRLGIVGAGVIGAAVARKAAALGMEPVFAARRGAAPGPGRMAFDEMLASADAISIHCPLNDDTRGLIGREEFRAMRRRPFLINTARGGIVDEAALVEALDRGSIRGAAFDVATVEPPPEGHPIPALAGRRDVIVTPHVAWASQSAMAALVEGLVSGLEAWARGEIRNRIA